MASKLQIQVPNFPLDPKLVGIEPARLDLANIPRLYWENTTADIIDSALREVCRRYIKNLDFFRVKGKGLFLEGPNGTGKTLCSLLILKAALLSPNDYTVYFTSLEAIKAMFTGTWRNPAVMQEYEKRIQMADFLAIDDLGKEYIKSGGLAETIFDQTIRHRAFQMLPTIITTNLSQAEMPVVYGKSVASLLFECAIRHKIDIRATDHRTHFKETNDQLWNSVERGE